jgi:hypothetical protein
LVILQPDIILAASTPATVALQRETRTIPIVFVNVSDPVASSIVERFRVGTSRDQRKKIEIGGKTRTRNGSNRRAFRSFAIIISKICARSRLLHGIGRAGAAFLNLIGTGDANDAISARLCRAQFSSRNACCSKK